MNLKKEAETVFKATLEKVRPEKFLPDIISFNAQKSSFSVFDSLYELHENTPLYVIGTGKAAHTMAASIEDIFGDTIVDGLVIVPPGTNLHLRSIRTETGSHPVPDEKSFEASALLLDFITSIPNGAVVFYLLSGGSSSLFSCPAYGISENNFCDLFKHLVESGASIQEINSVRKTVSKVKGGQLLEHLNHTTLLDLIISDIPDDDVRYVGSGPTTSQEISFPKAISILKKYRLWSDLPSELQAYFKERNKSQPKRSTSDFENHQQWIVSSASTVAKHTQRILKENGFTTSVEDHAWEGPVDEFKSYIMDKVHQIRGGDSGHKCAHVFYGECTVKVTGDGLGGRNQELALRVAKEISGMKQNVAFLSCGTDGIDGPTDAAGAVVDQNTIEHANKKGMNAEHFIERNDSYHFFEKAGGHVITGPTGNNVMDIQIVLID
jgi:glycerate-2-kinase